MRIPKFAVTLFFAVFLKLISKAALVLNNVSTLVGVVLYLYFLFTKVPNLLNRHFGTRIFKNDLVLRLSLVLLPSFLFVMLLLLAPTLLLPSPLQGTIPTGFSVAHFILISFAGVMFASFLVGVRLLRKRDTTLERILSKTETSDDLRIDQEYLNHGGTRRFLVTFQIGEQIAVFCAALFTFWLVMWIIDYAYVAFVVGWFIYEILVHRRISVSGRLRKAASSIDEVKDKRLFWSTFSLGALGGSRGRSVWFLGAVTICFSCLFLVVSLLYPYLFFTWLLFSGWYILLLGILIMRRLNSQVQLMTASEQAIFTYREIPRESLTIFAVSFLYVFMTLRSSRMNILYSVFAPHTMRLLFDFLFLEPVFSRVFALALLITVNAVVILSMARYASQPRMKHRDANIQCYLSDKVKLAWLCVLSGLLVAGAYTDIALPLMIFLGSIIAYCFEHDLHPGAINTVPWKYAAIHGSLVGLVGTGVFITFCMFSSVNEKTRLFVQPAIVPFALLWAAVLPLYIAGCYWNQNRRLRMRGS